MRWLLIVGLVLLAACGTRERLRVEVLCGRPSHVGWRVVVTPPSGTAGERFLVERYVCTEHGWIRE